METQTHILVVDDDKIINKTLTLILQRLGYKTTAYIDPHAALRWLQLPGNYPDLIISDVMMPNMSGYEFVSQVRSQPMTAHLPVILLTANSEIDNKVEGFRSGADDYMIKPVDRTELEWRIKALLARSQKAKASQPPRKEAKVISVFSLRGGAGTTTVAVNLAVALSGLWEKEIPLLDIAFKTGHCAMMLNLNPKHSFSNIVGWDTSTMDAETIEKLLTKHQTGVKLVAAPKSPAEAELITPDVIDRVWPYMRAAYPFIVADVGSQFIEPAITVLERSNYILLVLAPELGSLKAGVDALNIFKELGFGKDKIKLVINETFSGNGIPKHHIEKSLELKTAATIPNNRDLFVKAINTGQPHILTHPNSQASQAITKLAYDISPPETNAAATETPSPLHSWVRKLGVTTLL